MSRRASGLLLHPTSLPSHTGGLNEAARRFLSWAQAAGVSVWQILPVGPPGQGGSPYAALSAFAGDASWFVDGDAPTPSELSAFGDEHAAWLDDWAHYAALKEAHRGLPWFAWDEALRRRDPAALAGSAAGLRDAVSRHRAEQYVFHKGWSLLRERAQEHGIALLGDVPIYPALDSADVWAHQDLFWLDDEGAPTRVADVPPDYFCETGQLWGNPLYRWDRLRETGYAWWIERLRHGLALHDGSWRWWIGPADPREVALETGAVHAGQRQAARYERDRSNFAKHVQWVAI